MAADSTATTSFSAATISSMVTDPGILITLTEEEFNMFHNIDRQLFRRLVLNLGRDPTESMRVMALFIWLEKITKNSSIVYNLSTWADSLLNNLTNEVVMILSCINSEKFLASDTKNDLPLLQIITRSAINLVFFQENRHDIIQALTKILSDICIRAFNDIIEEVQHKKATKEEAPLDKTKMKEVQNLNHPPPTTADKIFHGIKPPQQIGYYNLRSPVRPASVGVVPHHHAVGMAVQFMQAQSQVNKGWSYHWNGVKKFNRAYEEDVLNNEFDELLNGSSLNDWGNCVEEASEVHPDDRTIFVTFSRGHPILKREILDFFTRKYGDIIEAIHMHEVAPLKKPLYARLVIHPVAIDLTQLILEGKTKKKFNINGKHAWARKYVPRNANKPVSEQVGSSVTS